MCLHVSSADTVVPSEEQHQMRGHHLRGIVLNIESGMLLTVKGVRLRKVEVSYFCGMKPNKISFLTSINLLHSQEPLVSFFHKLLWFLTMFRVQFL